MAGQSSKKKTFKDQMTMDPTDKAAKRATASYIKLLRKSRVALDKVREGQKFSLYLQNNSVLMRDLSSFLSDSVDLASVLQETAEVLKLITKAYGEYLIFYQRF